MNDVSIKTLIDKVEMIDANQKKVEKKAFKDYLFDKQLKGQFHDDIISFEDSEDYAYFEKITSNLGLIISDLFDL